MKTLILYATKYGAAAEIANRIAKRIDGAVVHDLKSGNIPAIEGFDRIILGSSVYAGSVRKEAKVFAANNAAALANKTVGLFISGFVEDDKYYATNYPKILLDRVKVKGFLGGIFDPAKAGAMERFITKLVMKQSGYINRIDDAAIDKFVNDLK